MSFRNTVIWKDIQEIITQKTNPYPPGQWKGVLENKIGHIVPLVIKNIDIHKDFVNKVSDQITVSFLIDKGTYLSKIYPYISNTYMTLYRYPVKGVSNTKPITYDFNEKYKAIFLNKHNYKPKGRKDEMVSTLGSELLDVVVVNMQLMPVNVLPMRLKWVSGTYLGYTPQMTLESVLTHELSLIKVNGKPAVDEIHIVKPDNSKPVKNLVVPSDTSILDYPSWLQHQGMGVYSAGLGTFVSKIDKKFRFLVYPTHKVNSKYPTLNLFVAPDFELGYNETTFKKKGNSYHIVGHIDGGYSEEKEDNELVHGVGFRTPTSHYYTQGYPNKYVKITKTGPQGQSTKVNYKVATHGREDGFNLAKRNASPSTSNPYSSYSAYIPQTGNNINFIWQQSDSTILYPSQKVVLHRLIGDTLVKTDGILSQITTIVQMKGKGIVNQESYTETTVLRFFVPNGNV